jgi:outer membrane protein assembly factor BamD
MNNGFRYRKIAILMLPILFMFFECGKDIIKMGEVTPEDQLAAAMRIYNKKDYYKAKMQFAVLVLNNPGKSIIEHAQFYLAECHFQIKEYLLAISEYEKLIKSLPQSSFVDDARYKIGLSYEKLSPGYGLDQEYTQKAISQYQQFVDDYPNSELISTVEQHLGSCQDKLAKKEFKTGELYRKMGYNAAAIISFDAVLDKYSNSQYVDDALFWKGECLRRAKSPQEAINTYQLLLKRFPDGEFAAKARTQIKELLAVKK